MKTGSLQLADSDSGEWNFCHMFIHVSNHCSFFLYIYISYCIGYRRNNTIQQLECCTDKRFWGTCTFPFSATFYLHHHILEANLLFTTLHLIDKFGCLLLCRFRLFRVDGRLFYQELDSKTVIPIIVTIWISAPVIGLCLHVSLAVLMTVTKVWQGTLIHIFPANRQWTSLIGFGWQWQFIFRHWYWN